MAKYIIIEQDPKVRRELLTYIRELDPDGTTLEFGQSKDFEQEFLLPLVRPKPAEKSGYNALQGLKPEIIQYLNNAQFSKELPFPGDVLILEVSGENLAVQKSNLTTGVVFGEELPNIFSANPPLEKFVQAEFKEAFEFFKKKVAAHPENEIQQVIAIEAPNREIWVIEVEATVRKKNIVLNLRNKRGEVLKLLGKEDTAPKEDETAQNLDVFIIRLSSILDKDPGAWITKIAALTKKLGLWPPENRPKFLVTRFEDEKRDKVDFYHPFVDDMLCMPFDRLMVLQKLEIIKALPEKASPSYLFVQETQDEVEVGKKVSIERMSDIGFAVANPFPLATGTPGHFYFKFPGQKALLDCYGKVTHSLPHPERPNEHLVFFAFFGLDRNVLKEVRAYLSRDTGYKMIITSDPSEFEYNPDNIFITEEQKRRKNVVVIDYDEKNLENVATILKKDISGLNVITDTSYYNFYRTYLTGSTANDKAPPAPKEDFYDSSVSLLVNISDSNLQMTLSPPNSEQTLLGHDAKELFASPQNWLDLFKNNHARNLLTECFHLVQSVKRIQRPFELDHKDGTIKSVSVEIILEENGQHARVNLTPLDPRTAMGKRVDPLETLDAVVVDAGSIPSDPDTFLNSINEALSQSGIKTFPEGPKIIFMANEKSNKTVFFKALKNNGAVGFVYKPIEAKRLCYLVHCAVENPFTIYRFDNIGWKTDAIPGKIAREALLAELAEFGATIRINQKFKTGSMIYLFKSIYTNAPDANLCCRVYQSLPVEGETGTFMNYVTYYGITDAFLKFTRSYIRETYAEKKAKESGGAEE